MIFRQFLHEDLGCASYLVGDEQAGVAAVVDPRWDVDAYLETAAYLGVRIAHVLETHNHADHASGHGRLVAATGATVHVHRLAAAEYEHEPFEAGWELALGDVVVRALHVPGHRPEHTAFVLVDRSRGPEPWAVLTGDSLLVGDVARPDLAIEPAAGARGMFRSLQEQLLTLPDSCEVWPGHVGGSLCGSAGINFKVCSTVGYERAHNPLLTVADEAEFVERSLAAIGTRPPNVETLVALNRGPLQGAAPDVPELDADALAARLDEGVLVVDVRDDVSFDAGHIPGSVSLALSGPGFGTRLATLVGPDEPVALVAAGDATARHAAGLAAAIGQRAFAGVLVGGLAAWTGPLATIERLPAAALPERLDAEPDAQVLDVREHGDWAAGHIPGSTCTPWQELTTLPSELDAARPVVVVCRSGRRAATAASLLERAGARRAIHVAEGGVPTWGALGRPLATSG